MAEPSLRCAAKLVYQASVDALSLHPKIYESFLIPIKYKLTNNMQSPREVLELLFLAMNLV
jgi:hypothetical protein